MARRYYANEVLWENLGEGRGEIRTREGRYRISENSVVGKSVESSVMSRRISAKGGVERK